MGGLDLDCCPPLQLTWTSIAAKGSCKGLAKDMNNMRLILAQSYCRTLRPLKLKVCLESWAIIRGMVMGRVSNE